MSPVVRELTPKAVVTGLCAGILFGSANAYLALRVGLTVGTSIPISILSVAIFRVLAGVMGRAGILEVNMVQTIGSASSSLASGLVFTAPALFLWGQHPSWLRLTLLSMSGAVLGVLAMIPLRRLLIVEGHQELPYPEGTACAEVLRAAETGGARARAILHGLGIGAIWKLLVDGLKVLPREVTVRLPGVPKGEIGLEPSAALVGIGYILGYRVAAVMVAGGLVASAVLIPLIAQFGEGLAEPMFPEAHKRIAEMSAAEIWSRYVRYIGAGAVAVAGLMTMAKSVPTIWRSFRAATAGLRARGAGSGPVDPEVERQDRDLPPRFLLVGTAVVVVVLAAVPFLLGQAAPAWLRVVGAIAAGVFCFFFATVSARIVGLVGTTSNPVSGMTIVTMLGVTGLLLALGVGGTAGQVLAMTVGTVVCTAASKAGDISQDLKTGYLVGATPRAQQIGQLICAIVAAPFIAGTLMLLSTQGGFGTQDMPAPQATLLKTIVEGVLSRDLPWGLVLTGGALAVVAELVGLPALAFAVGIYLPVSTMTPIFVGGCLRRFADARYGEERARGGVLLGSGLVAGEGVLGVGVAGWAFLRGKPRGLGLELHHDVELLVGLGALALLGWILLRAARRPA